MEFTKLTSEKIKQAPLAAARTQRRIYLVFRGTATFVRESFYSKKHYRITLVYMALGNDNSDRTNHLKFTNEIGRRSRVANNVVWALFKYQTFRRRGIVRRTNRRSHPSLHRAISRYIAELSRVLDEQTYY